MKANQLATLVFRLSGIYCLVMFIPFTNVFSSALFYAQSTNDKSGMLAIGMAALFLICWLGVGILLIAYSVPWGVRLTKGFSDSNITAIPFEQIQVLAFAVAGVLIFAGSLPDLLNSLYSLNFITNQEQYQTGRKSIEWGTLLKVVGVFLRAALGAWMFFGAHGFANLWRSFRNMGTPKQPEN